MNRNRDTSLVDGKPLPGGLVDGEVVPPGGLEDLDAFEQFLQQLEAEIEAEDQARQKNHGTTGADEQQDDAH